MPCISFNQRFPKLIMDGIKVHTMRFGKRKYRPGQILYMQTGPRFKPERFFTVPVSRVRMVVLTEHSPIIWHENNRGFIVPNRDVFARCDGFMDWSDLLGFFQEMHGETFRLEGQLVQWLPGEWE